VRKNISTILDSVYEQGDHLDEILTLEDSGMQEFIGKPEKLKKHIERLRKDMLAAAADLEFEEAAALRDQIQKLETLELGLR
jgi:excinuclease ABC subunit B